MKKFLFLFLTAILFSCSDDSSGGENSSNQTGSINVAGQSINFDHAYIQRIPDVNSTKFSVFLSKGELAYVNQSPYIIYKDNLESVIQFIVQYDVEDFSDLPSGDFRFQSDLSKKLNYVTFVKDIVIQNGGVNSSNSVFSSTDFIGEGGVLSISKNTNGTHSFSFHFTTSVGVVTGNYTGEATKMNF